mmetsp:Transcript_31181/g.81509  ORF Transcript_31181/g.81509 Transcript_31181/m.81509 type:complete len:209 (-) Transcript_31181:111-737(-)
MRAARRLTRGGQARCACTSSMARQCAASAWWFYTGRCQACWWARGASPKASPHLESSPCASMASRTRHRAACRAEGRIGCFPPSAARGVQAAGLQPSTRTRAFKRRASCRRAGAPSCDQLTVLRRWRRPRVGACSGLPLRSRARAGSRRHRRPPPPLLAHHSRPGIQPRGRPRPRHTRPATPGGRWPQGWEGWLVGEAWHHPKMRTRR